MLFIKKKKKRKLKHVGRSGENLTNAGLESIGPEFELIIVASYIYNIFIIKKI